MHKGPFRIAHGLHDNAEVESGVDVIRVKRQRGLESRTGSSEAPSNKLTEARPTWASA